MHTGVYADPDLVASFTRPEERYLLHDRAASLRIRAPHVASHDFAALELGLPVLRPQGRRYTHVTRPGVLGSHLARGVKHHLAPYAEEHVVEVSGRRVTGPARTAVDIAREHGYLPGLVAVDSARRVGATLGELEAIVAAMTCWPQVTVARRAVADSDPDTDSIGETLTRALVVEIGLGVPQAQFGLTDDTRTAWFDLRLGRHLIEFDGKVKYQRDDDDGGLADDPGEVVWREKRRQDWATGFHLGMSRVVWSDLLGDVARARAKARIEREYLATCGLWGQAIDDLTPYLARGPRPRPSSTDLRVA